MDQSVRVSGSQPQKGKFPCCSIRRLPAWGAFLTTVSLMAITGCGKLSTSTSKKATGSFAATMGNMQNGRFAFASARITGGPLSGDILLTGGISSGNRATSSVELYNPASGTFTLTGTMTSPRAYHTATALSDGTVLVVGGIDSSGNPLDSAELFNPATETFSLVTAPHLNVWQHAAVPFCVEHSGATYLYSTVTTGAGGGVCPDGYQTDVLIAGGFTDAAGGAPSGAAAIYDPQTQIFTPVSSLKVPVAATAAVLFPSTTVDATGIREPDVLIIGGTGAAKTSVKAFQLYPLGGLTSSPYVGTWQTSSIGLTTAVSYATVTVLANEPTKPTDFSSCNGVVIITGGQPMPSGMTADLFYLYAPGVEGILGTFLGTGPMREARVHHTATLLGLVNSSIADAGSVLLAGGEQSTDGLSFSPLNTAEIYTPAVQSGNCAVGSFTLTSDMLVPRWYHTATAFRDGTGRVLISGGSNSTQILSSGGTAPPQPLNSAEIFKP